MRFINIKQFRNNYKKELENLPVVVTKYGKPVAVVIPPGPAVTAEGIIMDLRGGKEENFIEREMEEFFVQVSEEARKRAKEYREKQRKAILDGTYEGNYPTNETNNKRQL